MNNKGAALVELLIVVVVLGIVASFSVIGVDAVLVSFRKNAFVQNAITIVDVAEQQYYLEDEIWDDNVATLRELIENDYLKLKNDPWGGEYDLDESYVTVEFETSLATNESDFLVSAVAMNSTILASDNIVFKCQIISENATIGYGELLEIIDKSSVVFLEGRRDTILSRITDSITGSIRTAVIKDDQHDEVNIEKNIVRDGIIDTAGGDDIVNVGGVLRHSASVSTGSGDDTVNVEWKVSHDATIDTGTGNDTVNLDNALVGRAEVRTGEGDDIVNVDKGMNNNSVVSTETGNDTVYVESLFGNPSVDAGAHNDAINIGAVWRRFTGTVDAGAGDDIVTITTIHNNSGMINGGSGQDTLNLNNYTMKQWNSWLSDLFEGFETINLKDGVIKN